MGNRASYGFSDERVADNRAHALITSSNTMTIATCSGNSAWAAPVYYVYSKGKFYFFSKPDSRHIKEALHSGAAGASIHAHADTWRDIRGLQMEGTISQVKSPLDAAAAVMHYLKRFPFTTELFKPGQRTDHEGFSERFGVRLYCFVPTIAVYCDNSIQFGFRRPVNLNTENVS